MYDLQSVGGHEQRLKWVDVDRDIRWKDHSIPD